MDDILFRGVTPVLRTVIVGVAAYAFLVLLLRSTGKRTLSKMNAFDLVVTVALGSTLATILLSAKVSFVQGIVALAVLAGLQLVIAWLSVRVEWVRKVVTGEPTLLAHRGHLLERALLQTRVTRGEVLSALRSAGLARLEDAEAVVLETDGSVSVVKSSPNGGRSALAGVKGVPEDEAAPPPTTEPR